MGILLIVQVIVCILLVGAILLQVGRGASTGAVFGGGVGTFFGSSGEVSFLGKVIIVLTVIFILNTVLLYVSSRRVPPPVPPSPPAQEESSMVPVFSDEVFACLSFNKEGKV
ncbi:preprotein translocase subunit SecG [Candidatus Aerophobetes bacterium]|nr:preprotein translocase subunit SecG [Candidatus Aerophobetes bacterium]